MSLATQLQTLQGRQAEVGDEIEAVGTVAETEGRDLTDDDQKQIQALSDEFEANDSRIKSLKAALDAKHKIEAARITPQLLAQHDQGQSLAGVSAANAALPARVARVKSKVFNSTKECFEMGMWIGAKLMQKPDCVRYCRDNGVGDYRGAMEGGTDNLGGYTVPDPLAATIIELVERWGVYRQYSRNVTMTSDTLDVPRLDASLTVYYPAEGASLTASDLTFGQVNLIAKKYAQLAIMSTELNEDSVISMTDLITRDMARNFAYSEDLNSFLGDGTGTYGGITGINAALNAGATVTASGTSIDSITLSDLQMMIGKVKEYGGISPRWFMHKYTYYNAVVDLLTSLGGTDMRQTEEGPEMMILGYPVTFTQVLPGDQASNNSMVAVFGDLDLGTYCGTRRQVSIRVLNELYAATDQIGIMGTMRADTQIHSVGDATEAGAITKLNLAAA